MLNTEHWSGENPPGGSVAATDATGFFCRPDCPAFDNAESERRSFPNPKTALEWGFNPCATCRPMDPEGQGEEGAALMDALAADPNYSVAGSDLSARGIDPARLRRQFHGQFGLSFQDFLRMRRLNHRFGAGANAEEPSPGRIVLRRLATPLGPMAAAASQDAVVMLEFAERRMLETQILRLERYHKAKIVPGTCGLFDTLQSELDDYFGGGREGFSLPLDLRGTPFQMRVWDVLKTIDRGKTCSYGEQARRLGNARAVRAVARANGENPVAIIVPCHRVLGADGSMTGYGGRIWRKEALLRLESGAKGLFG